MLRVDEARERVAAALRPLGSEPVGIDDAFGRTLAEDVRAKTSQPPFATSAMDGYAVRSADHGPRRVIGRAPAGHPYSGKVGEGETVRLFTGSVVPQGADAVLAQEDARMENDRVHFTAEPVPGKFIRDEGLDFRPGTLLLGRGKILSARDLALLAAADFTHAEVTRRPLVALAATGDELSLPGAPRKPGGIVASSVHGLKASVRQWGGDVLDLGIIPDRLDAIAGLANITCDLLVTAGGASVGDHDLLRAGLSPHGFVLDFWKIAMRPGKPVIFGHVKETPLLGLPGNPVSTFVCALLFLKPAIARMLGRPPQSMQRKARLLGALPDNGERQSYLRARKEWKAGEDWVRAFIGQDSSVLSAFSAADVLIVRPPYTGESREGELVPILDLD